MSRQADDDQLQSHLLHLRYAVATTTCRQTVAMLRQMLGQAEATLQREQHSCLSGTTLP